ncbi:hypothetical protein GDO81_003032 [Engystomops pustulosus]|uniref:Uncharacterized protein n=1 Tax=Engystomops pustulosus TaxID=76066 RepID=A0AAV7A368_ENGPU|nr:hypothetical protein GDO81_003032 [Engystomops pustulosus]KAG8552749.1 hypothetical protein GDO81_003032 [Engystomops pustulosus]
MGQGGSQELPSLRSTVNPEPQVEFFMDLEPFPDDILVMILSFVQERDLILHCRWVSRRWKHLVDAPSLWRIKCERERRREILHAAEMCPDFQWQRACLKNPFSRNLLRNPCGTGVSHEFQQYGPGVRYVNFTHKGKDTQFWKGWYGPRISNSSVTLKRGGDMEPCR